jgi:TonB-dependent starch-binding outer membrane protein SusC
MKKYKMKIGENAKSWLKRSILLFVSLLFISTAAFSQNERFTFNADNIKLRELLDKIQTQSSYKFLYRSDLVNSTYVKIHVSNVSLQDALNAALDKTSLSYQMLEDKLIVISLKDQKETKESPLHKISGVVTDPDTGESLIGVSVIVKGTSQGVITDLNGKFSLNVTTPATLVFSSIGYITQNVQVTNQNLLNVGLLQDTKKLDEVVVIGYGTQKKGDVTSSIATIKSDNFVKGSVKDVGQLIQGKVAGLSIISPNGDPTSGTQILLRGNTSLMGANQNPLVLIDGIPGDMSTVSPQDIESIDVLKDGSAAAIYGTRGTNGVILITTKGATGKDKSSVEYSTYVSTQAIARRLNMSTAEDFRAQITAGLRPAAAMQDYKASTDWLKEISRSNPLSQSHNLTFRGGNNITNYLLSLNYNNTQGMFIKSFKQVFSGRADINHSMFNNKLKININLLNSSDKWNGFNSNIYRQALMQNPTAPTKNADGTWFQELTKFEYQSPVSDLYESDGQTNELNSRYKGSIVYAPIAGLKLSSVFSYGKRMRQNGYAETKQNASTLRDNKNGYANIGGEESIDKLAELTAEYSKTIGDHSFRLLAGYSYQENAYNKYYMQNWDFPTDKFGYNNIGLGQAISSGKYDNMVSSYRSETNLIGLFSRLTYNYKDKYLFMASVRREEASQLWGTKNPWGTFPAASVGWRITKESFMSGQTIFDDIKIRAGYGVTGSQPSDLFKGVGIIDYGYGNVYSNGKWLKTLVPASNPNPDLKWEEKRETDFGVDFSMLNSRISGSVDYYNRQIHNLLSVYAVPSPPNLFSTTLANVGTMENKGVEVLLNFVPIKNSKFQWNTSVSYSSNRNKLVSITNDVYKSSTDYLQVGAIFAPIQTFSHLLKVGGPVGDFYGFKVIDIGNDPTDKGNYGQWVYEGADGKPVKYSDFKHSFGDKKVIGNGLPKFYMGWNNNFRYKNWDLSITQRGAFGFQVANLQRMVFENPTYTQYNVLTTAFDKVYGKTQLKSALEFNSYYIENGDYWKIDNITLGYTFNNLRMKNIQSARVYATVLNALIITGYKGIDPEVSLRNGISTAQSGVAQVPTSGLDPGMDSPYKYPTTRTFSLGLNITF